MKMLRIWYYDEGQARVYRTLRKRRYVRVKEMLQAISEVEGISAVRVLDNNHLVVFMPGDSDREFLWAATQPEVMRCIAGNIPWGPYAPIKGVVFRRLPLPRIFGRLFE